MLRLPAFLLALGLIAAPPPVAAQTWVAGTDRPPSVALFEPAGDGARRARLRLTCARDGLAGEIAITPRFDRTDFNVVRFSLDGRDFGAPGRTVSDPHALRMRFRMGEDAAFLDALAGARSASYALTRFRFQLPLDGLTEPLADFRRACERYRARG